MENIYMSRGASKVVNTCMKVQPGEQILIVTELSRLSIAQALATEVYRVGAEPAICIMEPRTQDSEEPPKEIAAAMLASDGFLSVVGKSITHTQAVKSAIAAGSRGLVLTHFTEEMMVHGGIEGDFEALKPICIGMAQAMAGSEKIVLTSPSGTHLEYSAKGRRGQPPLLYGGKGTILHFAHRGSQRLPPWRGRPTGSSWRTGASPTSGSACWRNRSL